MVNRKRSGAYRPRQRFNSCWVGSVRLDFSFHRRDGWRLSRYAIRRPSRRAISGFVLEEFDVPRKPETVVPQVGTVRKALATPRALAKAPTLASYLLDLDYEDGGGARQLSYLNIHPGTLGWTCYLKDPTPAMSLRLVVQDLDTLWAQLEALLTTGVCPWEPDQFLEERRNGKKRRR